MLTSRSRLLHALWIPVLFAACATHSADRPVGVPTTNLALDSAPFGSGSFDSTSFEMDATDAPTPAAVAWDSAQIAQTPSTRSDGRGGFRFDEMHAELFWMPFYTIEADEPSDSGGTSSVDDGQGFGAKIGIGDDDQGVGLLYMGSWHDESTTGTGLTSHALYANFHARGLFWRSRNAKGWARFDGGLGMAGIDFSGDYKDQTSGAINMRGAVQLEFNDKFSIDLGLGGYLWGVPGDTLAYGGFMTLGGSLRF